MIFEIASVQSECVWQESHFAEMSFKIFRISGVVFSGLLYETDYIAFLVMGGKYCGGFSRAVLECTGHYKVVSSERERAGKLLQTELSSYRLC